MFELHPLVKYVGSFGVPLVLVLQLTPILIKLSLRLGFMDYPSERNIHQSAIPLGGGIIIFIAFHLSCLFLYQFFWPDYVGKLDYSWWLVFLKASSILLLVGLIDDVKNLSPIIKLSGQIIASLIMFFYYQKDFSFMGSSMPLLLNISLVLVWNLVIINAFNLIDGLDGLCTGLASISSFGLVFVYLLLGVPANTLICLALAGACLGFLRYNYHPAKVFLGDAGSMFLGFTLATISLYAGGKSSFFVTIATPIFIAGVPIIDTLLAIWRRSLRKVLGDSNSVVKIMQADKEHLHHRLLAMGLNQHRVALILYAMNTLIVVCGLLYILVGNYVLGFFLMIFMATVYLLIKHVLQIERWETKRAFANLEKNRIKSRLGLIYHPLFDLIWMALSFTLASYIVNQGDLPFATLGRWIGQLPPWIMPTFILLFLSHSYNKIWVNAFFKDYLFLTLSVFAGCLLSISIISLLESGFSFILINQSLLYCLFTFIGVTGIRVVFHFVKEWGMNSEPPLSSSGKRNILLYGAGLRGGLYARQHYLQHSEELGLNKMVGFIDDNPLLRKRYVFGLVVFGGLNELDKIAKENKVEQIVITTTLTDQSFNGLLAIAKTLDINVIDWKTSTTQII